MSSPIAAIWQELMAELAREWGTPEVELMNEAMMDLHDKYDKKKKRLVGQTAMVVEDSVMLRMMLEEWLAKAGITITGKATNGFEALKLYNGDDEFDYVFLNVAMPEMDGIEALTDFKKNRSSMIIIVTSTKLPDLLLQAIKNGAHHVLYRPFDYKALISVMCSETCFSPEKYGAVASALTSMGIGLDGMSRELTQQDIFRLASLPPVLGK